MGALIYRTGEMPTFECSDALANEGFVLQLATTGIVAKCVADGKVFGIAAQDTVDPISETAATGKQVAVIFEGVANVRYNLASTDSDITIGSTVGVKGAEASGEVKLFTPIDLNAVFSDTEAEEQADEMKTIVGVALEAVAAPGAGNLQGNLKVLLRIPR